MNLNPRGPFDFPVTDSELDAFWGVENPEEVYNNEQATHVNKAIRQLKGGITVAAMRMVIAELSSSLQHGSEKSVRVSEAIEKLDGLYDELGYTEAK